MHSFRLAQRKTNSILLATLFIGAGALGGCTSSGTAPMSGVFDNVSVGSTERNRDQDTQVAQVSEVPASPQKPVEKTTTANANPYLQSWNARLASLRSGVTDQRSSANTASKRLVPIDQAFTTASVSPSPNAQAYAPPLLTEEEIAARESEQRIERLAATFSHGKCKGGWGKQASKMDSVRHTPGHRYYIEIRMRHTPPLPIGHTYTAYGRLDENGKKLDEHLVMLAPKGGYAGAAAASTVAMPSVMTPTRDDCQLKPVAAYRVSLSDHQYEALLRAIREAKSDAPRYQLFKNNCNHFTSRISESVGIKTPKNKYTASLVYMYDIIRENEGRNYRTAAR